MKLNDCTILHEYDKRHPAMPVDIIQDWPPVLLWTFTPREVFALFGDLEIVRFIPNDKGIRIWVKEERKND